ncbi:MAG: response regulator [Lachnospiraceae bacterium]|mgnify:CR=1 FL=1
MKVLIADDEDYTREGLIEAVDWEKFGIDEIMQAVNGAEAARIAQWFCPDIVISDIRMPQMDGLAFAEQLIQYNPDSRIIFISGYMEIEYLKSAIQLAAIDYIEKPIDLQALDRAIARAADEIRRIHQGKAAVAEHRELQQQKLFRLLTDKEVDERTLDKLFQETGALVKNGCFQCVAAILQNISGSDMKHAENRVCALAEAPANDMAEHRTKQIKEFIKAAGFGVVASYRAEKQQYEFVIAYPEKEEYRLLPLYQHILDKMPGLCIGVGVEAKNWRNVHNSYKTADMAVNCAFYQEDRRLFVIDETIAQKTFINPSIYGEFLQVMSESVSRLDQWCRELFEQLGFRKYYRREQVYTLLTSFLNALYQKYPYLYDACPQIRGEEDIAAHVMGLGTLAEIRELFFLIVDFMKEHQQEQSGYSRIVCGVQDYIEKHYQEESLSVAEIAEALHLSPAYLNVLFKQEMKMTLKQYLSNYRLEKAKRMLEQGYDKITEIAEKCGYASANYFAKVFKEATDVTPVEYRRQTGGGEG